MENSQKIVFTEAFINQEERTGDSIKFSPDSVSKRPGFKKTLFQKDRDIRYVLDGGRFFCQFPMKNKNCGCS